MTDLQIRNWLANKGKERTPEEVKELREKLLRFKQLARELTQEQVDQFMNMEEFVSLRDIVVKIRAGEL